MTVTTWRGWRLAAFAFALGYGLLRLYWAVGGRSGYTACDRTRSPGPAEAATGCGAEHVATLPFWQGWGAVALCGVLVAVTALAAFRLGRVASALAWGACVALVALSFPGHLLFEIPVAVSGQPADWRDLVNRLLLLGGGLLTGAAAVSARSCSHPRTGESPRPVAGWVRGWAYAGCAVPVLGFSVPHALWVLGVPLGIGVDDLREVRQNLDLASAVAICVAPAIGGLLTLGLGHRWGQVLPRWLPWLAGRRVPRMLALVPAGVVTVALTSYGVIGIGLMTEALVAGTTTWSQMWTQWAVAGTEVVFLGWGITLGVATFGYHRATRRNCEHCRAATTTSAASRLVLGRVDVP